MLTISRPHFLCVFAILLLLVGSSVALAQHDSGGASSGVSRSTKANAFYQQGETLYESHKYREALELYLKAAQADPSMTAAVSQRRT